MAKPIIYMIAGPNGAGKTTAGLRVLPEFLSVYEFINADEMARGLNPLNPASQNIAAGKLMMARMQSYIASGKSFAFETTGASHVFSLYLREAQKAGFQLGLIYFWLPGTALAKDRVRKRVAHGGHNIPSDVIERRYTRGLQNVINLYLPLMDIAAFIDGTEPELSEDALIAGKVPDKNIDVFNQKIWMAIQNPAEGKNE